MEKLVIVNRSDQILGTGEKLACHQRPGKLHRAFAAFVLNDKGEILLSKRSRDKPLWPLYWENTCSSHLRLGESYTQAGERRLSSELGFTVPLKYLFKFYYQADYDSKLSEHEICAVLVGWYSGKIKLNKREVTDIRWITFDKLLKKTADDTAFFAPWLLMGLEKIENNSAYRKHFTQERR